LTLNATGGYTYTLDNTNPAVNALLNGQTLSETYSYTITDADGDTSTTTLTITINGVTDSTPEITPIDGNNTETGQATVFEKGLVTPTDKSQTTTGTITVATPDGMRSVTIGGTTFTVAQLATFSVGSPSVGINTGEGTLIVTGFNIVAGPNAAPTSGTLSYSYTLNAAQPQTGGSAVTESTDRIPLVVTDNSSLGNTATSTLIVRIVDDTPTAKADTNSVIEGTTPAATTTQGNVFGTIGASAGDVADRIGADTTATPVTGVSFAGSIKTVGIPFNSAYGTLTLNANGTYLYALDNTNATVNALGLGQTLSETFSYTITDADGDTSTTTLSITINGRNDAPIAVNDIQTGISGQPVIINVLGNDSDPENNINPATVRIVGTAKAGDSLEVTGEGIWSVNTLTGAITFTPFAGFTADPTPISYTVTDRAGLTSNPATVTVDYPQNPPLAVDNTVTGVTGKAITITVLDNDSDPENDINPATLHIVGTANAGDSLVVAGQGTWSVDVSTGTITFTPNLGFTGSPTPISYTVSDNTGLMSNAARVTVNYPPVIVTDINTGIGTSGSLIMLSNPDKTDSSSKYNEEEKKVTFELKFKPDNQLPPAHLSLYVPIRHHVISLTGSLRDQVVLELERYSFSVPRWMFRHTDPNEQLEFEAARPDGSSLPEWLTFNPKTLKFSGVPPKGAHDERVMVTARDTYGNEVHATFNVHVNRERMRSITPHKVLDKHKLGEKRTVGKAGLSEQIHAMGKLSKLQESRALLDGFKSVVTLADK
jgi:VCBS repeat-containing protein/CshA-type fibril repeat protein